MLKKRTFLFLLFGLIFSSAYLALFVFDLYRERFWREALAIVMICGELGMAVAKIYYYHPNKKITIGFPSLASLSLILVTSLLFIKYVVIKIACPLLPESLLFFVLMMVFLLIIITFAFIRFEE